MDALKEKLQTKLEQEYKDFIEKVKEKGVDYAINKSYEITTKREIIDCILYDNDLGKTQIKALLNEKNVLDVCYDDWLKTDGNMREILNYSVDESISYIVIDYKEEHIKTKNDAR